MPTTDQQRHQMIERAVRLPAHEQADISSLLWNNLADELRALVGAGTLESLYIRSAHRAGVAFPWIAPSLRELSHVPFELIDLSVHARDADEAQAANAALLTIFTDTLTLLIGELLTNNILRKAWGDDIVDIAGMEHPP